MPGKKLPTIECTTPHHTTPHDGMDRSNPIYSYTHTHTTHTHTHPTGSRAPPREQTSHSTHITQHAHRLHGHETLFFIGKTAKHVPMHPLHTSIHPSVHPWDLAPLYLPASLTHSHGYLQALPHPPIPLPASRLQTPTPARLQHPFIAVLAQTPKCPACLPYHNDSAPLFFLSTNHASIA